MKFQRKDVRRRASLPRVVNVAVAQNGAMESLFQPTPLGCVKSVNGRLVEVSLRWEHDVVDQN